VDRPHLVVALDAACLDPLALLAPLAKTESLADLVLLVPLEPPAKPQSPHAK